MTTEKKKKVKPLEMLKKRNAEDSAADKVRQLGHNSRGVSQFLIGKVTDIEAIDRKIKDLRSQQKGLINDIKQQGYSVTALRDKLRDRRMDPEERRKREEDRAIISECLGEQLSLLDQAALGRKDAGKEQAPDPDDVAAKRAAAPVAAPATTKPAVAAKAAGDTSLH